MGKFITNIAIGYIAVLIVVGMWGLFFEPASLWIKVMFVIGLVGIINFIYRDLAERRKNEKS